MLLAANTETLADNLERAMERRRAERGTSGRYLENEEDWD